LFRALPAGGGAVTIWNETVAGWKKRLPPTGTGAPPCLQQRPWELNGATRYFPHLEPAPP
jgi:hypothetical protein